MTDFDRDYRRALRAERWFLVKGIFWGLLFSFCILQLIFWACGYPKWLWQLL